MPLMPPNALQFGVYSQATRERRGYAPQATTREPTDDIKAVVDKLEVLYTERPDLFGNKKTKCHWRTRRSQKIKELEQALLELIGRPIRTLQWLDDIGHHHEYPGQLAAATEQKAAINYLLSNTSFPVSEKVARLLEPA